MAKFRTKRNFAKNPSRELYSAMEDAYAFFNMELFSNKLPDVVFTVQRSGMHIGGFFAWDRWKSTEGKIAHEISLNPARIAQSSLRAVMSVLVHEMVHCWQQCYGKPGRRGYHNKEWAYKMADIGLMPSDTGEPRGGITGEQMTHFIIENGSFIHAYDKLVKQNNYKWKWLDTQPMPFVMEVVVAHIEDLNKALKNPFDANITISRLDNRPEFLLGSLLDPEEMNPRYPDAGKNKTKYSCASCGMNLWGQSGHNVVCGDCLLPLIER